MHTEYPPLKNEQAHIDRLTQIIRGASFRRETKRFTYFLCLVGGGTLIQVTVFSLAMMRLIPRGIGAATGVLYIVCVSLAFLFKPLTYAKRFPQMDQAIRDLLTIQDIRALPGLLMAEPHTQHLASQVKTATEMYLSQVTAQDVYLFDREVKDRLLQQITSYIMLWHDVRCPDLPPIIPQSQRSAYAKGMQIESYAKLIRMHEPGSISTGLMHALGVIGTEQDIATIEKLLLLPDTASGYVTSKQLATECIRAIKARAAGANLLRSSHSPVNQLLQPASAASDPPTQNLVRPCDQQQAAAAEQLPEQAN